MKSTSTIITFCIIISSLCLFNCDEETDPFPLPQKPELCLNEFMARNDSTVVDESGEADDWVEIYNAVDSEGDICGYYLTDDAEDPGKWPLPDTFIGKNGFLLIWADDDTEQGQMHANFKISGSGEFLGLYHETDSGFVVIDSLTFPEQYPDTSYARSVDGSGKWIYLENPTPGMSNDLTMWSITDGYNIHLSC